MEKLYKKLKPNKKLRFIITKSKNIILNAEKNKLQPIVENHSTDIAIDAIFNNKRITKTIELIDLPNLQNILKDMKEESKLKDLKFYNLFPVFKTQKKKIKYDAELENINFENIANNMLGFNKKIDAIKNVKSVQSSFEFAKIETNYISEKEIRNNKRHVCSFSYEVVIKDKSESSYFDSIIFFHKKEINFQKIFEDAKKEIETTKNAKECNIDTKKYDLIFMPRVTSEITHSFIISQVGLESCIKKDNYLNQGVIFDKKLNIYENPFVDYSPSSFVMDYDFVPTTKKHIIKNGKFTQYLTNLKYAYKYNKKPTGNAFSGITTTNLILEPGKKSIKELIAKTKKGLVIYDLVGLHTTNAKEGSLNVAVGCAVEIINGKKIRVLKGFSLNENIVDLLKKIELSKEHRWVHSHNVPYLFCHRG